MIVTYELSWRFASALGASPRLSSGISVDLLILHGSASEHRHGVRPRSAAFLVAFDRNRADDGKCTPRRAAKLGLIASLAILARIDIAIAVAMLIVGFMVLVRPPLPSLARILGAFGLGGILLPLYALANYIFFGSPLPMSAVAKRLAHQSGIQPQLCAPRSPSQRLRPDDESLASARSRRSTFCSSGEILETGPLLVSSAPRLSGISPSHFSGSTR